MEDEVRPLMLLDQISNQATPPLILPWDPFRARRSGILILVAHTLERFAFYSVIMNLFLYLNKGQPETQSWEPIDALTAIYLINGVSCLCSPLSGCLSDSLLGRYWAVVVGMLIYILGYCLLTALSINALTSTGCDWQPSNNSKHWHVFAVKSQECSIHIYIILVLIGIGVGFMRANIPPFGAEQVRAGGDNAVRQFFNTYYWCANIGSLFGVAILAYVEQNVQEGFFISYIVATTALCTSLAIFCSGRCYYVVHRPGNAIILNMFRIIGEGCYNSCRKHESVQSSPLFRRESQQQQRFAPLALTPSWIDRAKVSYGGSFHDTTVEDVKKISKNLVFIFVLLPYWLVYFQMSTSFQAQGLHMNVHLNESVTSDFQIPSAWLTLSDQIFILLLIPLLNVVIYPWLDRKGIRTIPLYRILIGMVISLMAVLTAAIVEHFRIEEWQQGHSVIQVISGTSYNASAMSILYQIPQYCLIGGAEVFAGVAGLEYAYTTSPRTFQGIVMGMYAAIEGLSSILGVLLVQVTRSLHLGWIRSENHFNQSHLDYFFYLLAVIQALAIIILGLVTYLRWEPPRRDPIIEETLGASALHTEFYQNAEPTPSTSSAPHHTDSTTR